MPPPPGELTLGRMTWNEEFAVHIVAPCRFVIVTATLCVPRSTGAFIV